MLQDRLEDYIDVSVGNAKMIDPSFLVEERVEYLIIGDIISDLTPNMEIQNWLLQYLEVSKQQNFQGIKNVSGFYVAKAEIKIEPLWIEFLQDNVEQKIIYPPILRLMLNKGELALENGEYDKVKDYSNDLIDFIIETKKKK
ncbi:MAG: hypothetical protein ACXADU_01470 [Promethearchaeota archaeon]|jgi:hypothetical protein